MVDVLSADPQVGFGVWGWGGVWGVLVTAVCLGVEVGWGCGLWVAVFVLQRVMVVDRVLDSEDVSQERALPYQSNSP